MLLKTTWKTSLHQPFRFFPSPTGSLRPFLESDGLDKREVLAKLPYDAARAGPNPGTEPDPKRYRDGRQMYQRMGLLYEADRLVHVTYFGKTVLRWLDLINEKNADILGRHAAYALGACQLRNPTHEAREYAPCMEVFPFAFIWRAMLALDNRINTPELARAILKVKNEDDLSQSIEDIHDARQKSDYALLGSPVDSVNDHIIPWMSLASFGWTLIRDKRSTDATGYYTIPTHMQDLLREASRARHKHRDFATVQEYFNYMVRAAALPKDLR